MTSFLLDTNVLLWYFWGNNRAAPARKLIEAKETKVFISAASLWEITIKIRTGKLDVDMDELCLFIQEFNFFELPITREYLKAYRKLPQLHKDPFDHMLLAQAITCPMRLITGDSQLAQYSSLIMVV